MTHEEMTRLVDLLLEEGKDYIISISESASFFGDVEAITMLPSIKDRLIPEAPLRVTSPSKIGDQLDVFVFGEARYLKDNPEYREKFFKMSTMFGPVGDILGMDN